SPRSPSTPPRTPPPADTRGPSQARSALHSWRSAYRSGAVLGIRAESDGPQVMPIGTQRRTYRPDVDGLRAVAVLAVLGFHAFPGAVTGGFAGVDVFFVISGYLISGIILQELGAGLPPWALIRGFYLRRIRRIFPALLVVLASCAVAGWVFL